MMNEGINISYKVVLNQVCIVVDLLVDISTTIEKTKASIKLYTSIK